MENENEQLLPLLRQIADKYFERRKTLPRAPRHLGFKNFNSMTKLELQQLLLTWNFDQMPDTIMDKLFNFFDSDEKQPNAVNWTKFLAKLEEVYYNQGFPQNSKHFQREVQQELQQVAIENPTSEYHKPMFSDQLEDIFDRLAERFFNKFNKITKKTVFKPIALDEKVHDSIDFAQFLTVMEGIEFHGDVLRKLFDYFHPVEGMILTEKVVKKLNDTYFGRHTIAVENPEEPQSGVAFMGSHRKCLVLPKKTLLNSGRAKELQKYKRIIAEKFVDSGADWNKIIPCGLEKIDRERFKIILHNWHFYINEDIEQELFDEFSKGKASIGLNTLTCMLKEILGMDQKYKLSF